MRGLVLLCLFGMGMSYNWNPTVPTNNQPNQDNDQNNPAEPNLCLSDASACGCCLMEKQLYRMEQLFNLTMGGLQNSLVQAQTALNKVRTSRSAFSVALDGPFPYGPYSNDLVLVYRIILLNLGEGYNSGSGVFTAPRSGVYSLALTVYSKPSDSLNTACAILQVNGEQIGSASESSPQDREDSASIAIAARLSAGDQVSVRLPAGCALADDFSHYNTFTGCLLYSTD
ncbi:hypothetical protein AAFF_G00346130 [Aldrovandia affinis]|uniref:C1q domain-containing protein n=1 Tax=Aldrovandia affinis TaxID=143900 RepID=A0AAD7SJF2_9TELE|nr:hypothetical protein AAFF_G00346130 [Aldrovandia affinis]